MADLVPYRFNKLARYSHRGIIDPRKLKQTQIPSSILRILLKQWHDAILIPINPTDCWLVDLSSKGVRQLSHGVVNVRHHQRFFVIGQWHVHEYQTTIQRLSYLVANGFLPNSRKYQIFPVCRDPKCCNPSHLRVYRSGEANRPKRKNRVTADLGYGFIDITATEINDQKRLPPGNNRLPPTDLNMVDLPDEPDSL
jgi:hypothetical protein